MTRLIVALSLAAISVGASAADKPLPVTVANPVLKVEVSNADPIPVENISSATEYWGESRPPRLLVLNSNLASSRQLSIGTITVSNQGGDPGFLQIQARGWLGGECTDAVVDEMAPMFVAPGDTHSFSFPLPLMFPSLPVATAWCLVAETGANQIIVSVVAR